MENWAKASRHSKDYNITLFKDDSIEMEMVSHFITNPEALSTMAVDILHIIRLRAPKEYAELLTQLK